jgi:hypothetical protein
MAFIKTYDRFPVYLKDELQDSFTILLRAGLDDKCIASENNG